MRFCILALTLASFPAFAQDAATISGAPAPDAEDATPSAAQRMLANLHDEGKALEQLAATIKEEAKSGRVKVTPEAMARFEEGKAMWQETRALGEAGKTKAAYEKMRGVREAFGQFLMAGMSGKPSKSVRAGFQELWAVYNVRVDEIVGWAKENPPSEPVRVHLTDGQALWKAAQASAEAGKFADAWTSMMQGIEKLDHVMWDTYQGE